MEIIWIIVIGFLAGLLARILMPGKDPGGFIITVLLGIGGAIVASYLGRFFGLYGPGETAGFIASVIGAIIILAVYRAVKKK